MFGQMFDRMFRDHPRSVGESYGTHMLRAFGFGLAMILGGLACLVHGLVPGLFTRTGSDVIRSLHRRMVTHRVPPHAALGRAHDWVI